MAKNKVVKGKQQINIKNKRASFDYEFVDTFTAGIVLTGTEIKSIRAGKASLVDTYCYINNGEIWVKNMYVALYEQGSYNNHVERRERKLLLNRKEIRNLMEDTKAPGFTIVPVRIFINEKGLAKMVIALARGKKEYDKRQSLKEKEDKRMMDMAKKHNLY
ncbi:MAG: SsrA-binding protein SmpB [Prevotellaceae bacterium]|nr:SsrA-binding protein SmpB [Candidatus Minthosoma equi]